MVIYVGEIVAVVIVIGIVLAAFVLGSANLRQYDLSKAYLQARVRGNIKTNVLPDNHRYLSIIYSYIYDSSIKLI